MRCAVVGAGYVGLVTGACLAEAGNHVAVHDIEPARIAALQAGKVPFYEPGLDDVVRRAAAAGRLRFTTDLADAAKGAEVAFVAVGTPPGHDGGADLSYVESATDALAKALPKEAVLAVRSTVPPGTGDAVAARLAKAGRGDVEVVSAPEFLAEGTAVKDFQSPERVLVGGAQRAADRVLQAFAQVQPAAPRLVVARRSAELAKYAANTFLAARVSLVNEMAALCDATGADVRDVARAVGLDSRVGAKFLRPGIGYGGSCFPKDVAALEALAARLQVPLHVVPAVQEANRAQLRRALAKATRLAGGSLRGKAVAVLGIAFKPGTDDVREAPAVALVRLLADAGATVRAHDPKARLPAALAGTGTQGTQGAHVAHGARVAQVATPLEAVAGADLAILATEWPEYARLAAADVKAAMRGRAVLDGRNHLDHAAYRKAGLEVEGIGLGLGNGGSAGDGSAAQPATGKQAVAKAAGGRA